MTKVFNTSATCSPKLHYMVNIENRLIEIKKMVDAGMYFTINRARQYGKTTTLLALEKYLKKDYYVILLDFQDFDTIKFRDGHIFSLSFASSFLRELEDNITVISTELQKEIACLRENATVSNIYFSMKELFEGISNICAKTNKPLVLMIDEVDNAANNQVFLDFLAQLRSYYIKREKRSTFQSVILASVYDIKNLKQKLRPEDEHKSNSPWNIAADFEVEMSFSTGDIAGMLAEYEKDYHTGMNVNEISKMLYDYTSGYPFLVSRICKIIDEKISPARQSKALAWTKDGFSEAIRLILTEKNTLFESLIDKIKNYPELNSMIRALLFTGKSIVYNSDESAIDIATMFGFIKNNNGGVEIANRIFETRLYNFYLSTSEMQGLDIYKESLQ